MAFLENLVEGLSEAAGNDSAVNRIEKNKGDRRATQQEELHANTGMILDEVKRLHTAKDALQPGVDDQQIKAIDSQLGKLQQSFTDMYHPEKSPGALQHLGGILRSHLGGKKQPAQLNPDGTPMIVDPGMSGGHIPRTPGEAKARFSWADYPAGIASQPDAVAAFRRTYKEATGKDATPEVMEAFARKQGGIPEPPTKADWKPFKLGDRIQYFDLNDPKSIPAEASAVVAGSTPKPQNRDDKYIGIIEKQKLGQPLTPEDKAYRDAYDLYVKQTKVDPGVARAAAYGANRFIPVLDPSNPENVIFMRAGQAAAAHVGSPQSISFQVDKAITRAFTSGQPAQTINYFNTATSHLQLLQETADALQNNNFPLVNKWANAYASATGLPAPADFDTVRAAVAGELSKTFKGTGATDEEIATIGGTINSAQSPEQLHGVIGYYLSLMSGKMSALQGQFEAGKQGKPNFPSPGDLKNKAATAAGQGPAVGTVEDGYRFKGGDASVQSNWEKVK